MDTGENIPGRARSRQSWADIPREILGTVLDLLPCLADRARVRSVCRPWRAAARLHRPPPPLPLLVLSKFEFSSFYPDGVITAIRRIPLPEVVAADHAHCVGSYEGWLVGAHPSKLCRDGDGECFLLNPFSQAVVRLPHPCTFHFFDNFMNYLPIVNGSGELIYTIRAREYAMSFRKVVLSTSPDSGSKCIVAALSLRRGRSKLALWRPGMTSWCVCEGSCICAYSDLAFYQGKLYTMSRFNAFLYVYELGEDDHGMVVSHVERCVTEALPKAGNTGWLRCNLLVWRGKLLVVVRHFNGYQAVQVWHKIYKIAVFALNFSTNPYKLTEIDSLEGDCIFISSCSNKSFPAYQYHGVEDDCVYFVDDDHHHSHSEDRLVDPYVYNMKDGTLARFTIGLSDNIVERPVWFFPPV